MICNECNRVFSFYQNSRFYLQVAFSSASKLKWMQNERGGKTSGQASRSQKFGVTVKSREKSRGLVSNARIRCTQKKQQPSTTGASRIYGRALLSLTLSLLSLSLSRRVPRIRPVRCSEKAKPAREDFGVTLCSGSRRSSERDFLFLRMEMSRHFFHHGLIQCLLARTSYFPLSLCRCSTYSNVSTISPSPSLKHRSSIPFHRSFHFAETSRGSSKDG